MAAPSTKISTSRSPANRLSPARAYQTLRRGWGQPKSGSSTRLRMDHLAGMIAGAHVGPAGDVLKSEQLRQGLQFLEFFWGQIASDGDMFQCRRQILTEREHIAPGVANIRQRFEQLFARFTQAEHEACFRSHVRGRPLDVSEQFE